MKLYASTVNCFQNIVTLNFVMNTWFIGQALLFSAFSNWFSLFLITPFMTFDAFIYCYAMQRVKSKVWKLRILTKYLKKKPLQLHDVTLSIYSLEWYNFEFNSDRKSLMFIMKKFQNPIDLKLFRVHKTDLELFVFVSWIYVLNFIIIFCSQMVNTAFSIFSLMKNLN